MIPTKEAMQLMLDGARVLAQVEHNGIRIDTDYLERIIAETDAKIKTIETELKKDEIYAVWRKLCGQKTNLGSREQLGKIIFGKLGHPCPGKTKTGRWRTDESAFEHLDIPFVKKFLVKEKLKKMRSTYLGGIKRETVDGFLHPFINLHTAVTYRSSCDSPNLQNLPARNPEIVEAVRTCFIPRPGNVLVEPDFGALEFSVAACFWKDPRMVAYASDPNKDIHRDMAAKIFLCAKEEVNKTTRYVAKNQFVFPELYGSYYVQMARNIWEAIDSQKLKVGDVPVKKWLKQKGIKELGACDPSQRPRTGTFEKHMKQVEDDFNQKMFPVFASSKVKWWNDYTSRAQFRLMTGFVIGGNYSRNFLLNSPIQGPGFHLLLMAMILEQNWLWKREELKTLIVNEIHDCMVLDVPERELQRVLRKIKHIMIVEVPKLWPWVIVPLKVEIDVTPVNGSWFLKSPWHEMEDGTWAPAK